MVISKKTKVFAAIIIGAVMLYSVTGFYLLPFLLRSQLPTLVKEKVGLEISIQGINLNPFNYQLSVDGFSLAKDNKKVLAFSKLAIDFNLLSSISQKAVVFDSVLLDTPIIDAIKEKDGQLNLNKLLSPANTKEEKKQTTTSIFPLQIKKLDLNTGEINWSDLSLNKPAKESLSAITVSITDVNTLVNTKGSFNLDLKLASGGELQTHGELALTPLDIVGQIKLVQLDVAKLSETFLPNPLPITITQGKLSTQLTYNLATIDNKQHIELSQGELNFEHFDITDKLGNASLITLPSLVLQGIGINVNEKIISVSKLSSKDAVILASLDNTGQLNYQTLFAKPDTVVNDDGKTTKNKETEKPWQIHLAEFALNNYQLLFTDLSLPTPIITKLNAININLQKLNSSKSDAVPLQVSTQVNELGTIKLDGNIFLNPFNTDLNLAINNIKLRNYQHYLDNIIKLELIDGGINAQGHLQINTADALQLLFQGDVDLANLLTRDKINHQDFLKWNDLQLQQIDVNLAKKTFNLGKVVFDHPYLRLTIRKDKSTNIADIMPTDKDKTSAVNNNEQQTANGDNQAAIVNIGKIQLQEGMSNFADYSLILPFVADMDSLNGQVEGFSTLSDNPLKLTLNGKVYNLALVNIQGSYQLKSGDANIDLKFSHLPLPLVTPYMAEFAGYKIEKGQMALDLEYKTENGQLNAQNKILIDQLTLGDQIDNPHASTLPLQFAIALLKDADGKINLDFPVTGSLNDPHFSVGALLKDVLSNMIEKLVSSPFQALGNLLGSDEHDYSQVTFNQGRAELTKQESEELEQIAKALLNKPDLTLEIKGKAYQNQDWPSLRFDALTTILKKMKSGELRDLGENVRSEYIELNDTEYKRLLAKFFKEVFPQDIDYTLLKQPFIKSQPNEEFYEAARLKIEAVLPPESERLMDLAISRANSIAKHLLDNGIDLGRIYLLAPEVITVDSGETTSVLSLNIAH